MGGHGHNLLADRGQHADTKARRGKRPQSRRDGGQDQGHGQAEGGKENEPPPFQAVTQRCQQHEAQRVAHLGQHGHGGNGLGTDPEFPGQNAEHGLVIVDTRHEKPCGGGHKQHRTRAKFPGQNHGSGAVCGWGHAFLLPVFPGGYAISGPGCGQNTYSTRKFA